MHQASKQEHDDDIWSRVYIRLPTCTLYIALHYLTTLHHLHHACQTRL